MSLFLTDKVNFLSKLSAKRIINASKLWSSYQVSALMRRPIQWGVPYTISFEPTTACNLRCPECPSGLRSFTRNTGNLKSDFFKTTIDKLSDRLLYLIFYFQGEPFINPEFLDMVNYASRKRIYTITSTNAHFLNDEIARKTVESGLDRIIISIDGSSQETYEAYRKEGQLSKVLEGAKNLVYWKKELKSKKPHIIFQFLVVRPNEHEIPEIYKLAKEIGVDEVKLKTAQLYDFKNGNELMPINPKYSRYELLPDGTYKIKNELKNKCWKLWHAAVITWDGIVVPCCFDKDAKHRMGDLKVQDFDKIWRAEHYQSFRNKIVKGRDQIDICTNCTEGCKVWT